MVKEIISFLEKIKFFTLHVTTVGCSSLNLICRLSHILLGHLSRHLPSWFCTHFLSCQTQATCLASGANLSLSTLLLETFNWCSSPRLRDCMRSSLFWDLRRHRFIVRYQHFRTTCKWLTRVDNYESMPCKSQKSEDVIYTTAEAWNHVKILCFKMMLEKWHSKTVIVVQQNVVSWQWSVKISWRYYDTKGTEVKIFILFIFLKCLRSLSLDWCLVWVVNSAGNAIRLLSLILNSSPA
jgi:hypothetical protein